ncbi:MAG: transposase family protein, partial [Chlamydiales bacterium]|nr:transposase family protein [Chlamydiales bacterium]
MNKPKCTELDYINFLIASQRLYSCTKAERVLYFPENPASHDAFNRVLYRTDDSSNSLWNEAKDHIS